MFTQAHIRSTRSLTLAAVTEVLLPVILHFFCFFVEALLRSVELVSVENFDDAADRIMCRMHVTGTSYAWNGMCDRYDDVVLCVCEGV